MTVTLFFAMPETAYVRNLVRAEATDASAPIDKESNAKHAEYNGFEEHDDPRKYTFVQSLKLFHGKFTEEPILKMFIRPIGLLLLPPVLWATLVMSVLIGFSVAISSNFSTAFSQVYKFEPYQSGLCFISAFVGSVVGIAFGGHLTDLVADRFTKRNRGIREPEMRLPVPIMSTCAAPVSLILYGVGIQHKWHWMVPTLGLGLREYRVQH